MSKFVLQRHDASHLHYDFRLEYKGVMKSWAVPKGLSTTSGIKRLAVPTEDHDLEWATFEGRIPKGLYGAGVVDIADKGKYDIIKWEKNFIEINLHGKKFKDVYCLRKVGENWIIWKKAG